MTTIDRGRKPCVFPFTYINPTTRQKTTFSQCTTVGDPNGATWCSTKVSDNGYHLKGNWGHCPANSQRELQQRDYSADAKQAFNSKSMLGSRKRRMTTSANVWSGFGQVSGFSGPPVCVQDCPRLDKVTDQNSLACFSACAMTHPCTSDCSQDTKDRLNREKLKCDNGGDDGGSDNDGDGGQCSDIKTALASSVSSVWDGWGSSRRKLQLQASFWSDVSGKAGPPACLQDCQYLDKVTNSADLACFAKCAVTLDCVSDCSQDTMTFLNQKKATCGQAPQPATPAPTPRAPSADTRESDDTFSRADSPNPVVVLPDCLKTCKGFDMVLSSQLNCVATKNWAAAMLQEQGLNTRNTRSVSGGVWDIFNRRHRRRLQQLGCTQMCDSGDMLGLKALSTRPCNGSMHE